MSGSYATVPRKRSAGPIILLILGIIGLLVGGAALVFAAEYKPTIENVLSNGGDVLSQSDYDAVRAFGFGCLVVGGIMALAGFIGLVSRPSVVVQPAPLQQWAQPHPQYGYQAPPPAPVQHGNGQWAPPPVPAAPPPDPAQRVG